MDEIIAQFNVGSQARAVNLPQFAAAETTSSNQFDNELMKAMEFKLEGTEEDSSENVLKMYFETKVKKEDTEEVALKSEKESESNKTEEVDQVKPSIEGKQFAILSPELMPQLPGQQFNIAGKLDISTTHFFGTDTANAKVTIPFAMDLNPNNSVDAEIALDAEVALNTKEINKPSEISQKVEAVLAKTIEKQTQETASEILKTAEKSHMAEVVKSSQPLPTRLTEVKVAPHLEQTTVVDVKQITDAEDLDALAKEVLSEKFVNPKAELQPKQQDALQAMQNLQKMVRAAENGQLSQSMGIQYVDADSFASSALGLQFSQALSQSQSSAAAVKSFSLPSYFQQSNWSSQLGDRMVWMSQNNINAARLQLNPPELGPIHVRVDMREANQAVVQFSSDFLMVRDALESAAPRLKEMFDANGIQLLNVDVSDFGQSQQPGQDKNMGEEHSNYNFFQVENQGESESQITRPLTTDRRIIDVYA